MSLRPLGYIAIAEAASFICLLIATAVKYGADKPIGVDILGPVHGMLFVAYVLLAFVARQQRKWPTKKFLTVLAAAVIPIAGYFVGHKLIQEESEVAPTQSA